MNCLASRQIVLLRVIPFLMLVLVAWNQLAQARTWSDKSGKFSVEAEFVDLIDDAVHLKKEDGSVIKVPLAKLSAKDQTFAKKQLAEIKENRELKERKEVLEYDGGKVEVPSTALVQLDIRIIDPSDNKDFVMGVRPGFVVEIEGIDGVIAIAQLSEMARLSPPLLGDDLRKAIKEVHVFDDANGKQVAKADELLLVPKTAASEFDATADFVAVRLTDGSRFAPLQLETKPVEPDDIGLLVQPERGANAAARDRRRTHRLFKLQVTRARDTNITFSTEPEHREQISSMTGPPVLNTSGKVVGVYTSRAETFNGDMRVLSCPAALLKSLLTEAAEKTATEL